MSTKTKAKDKDAAADGEEGKGGGKKKLLLVLVVLLVAAGAGAYFFLFAGSGEAAAEEPVAGEVLALEPVTVNLAGGGYLKIGITLQGTEAAASGHGGGLDGSKALDILISTYSQAQPADVTGAREALKESLEHQIVEAYTEDGEEMVMGIYLTEYVTQ
ncbi:flagellar basal body-associated FliL family protein [Geodermatophilus sp. URMC 63]